MKFFARSIAIICVLTILAGLLLPIGTSVVSAETADAAKAAAQGVIDLGDLTAVSAQIPYEENGAAESETQTEPAAETEPVLEAEPEHSTIPSEAEETEETGSVAAGTEPSVVETEPAVVGTDPAVVETEAETTVMTEAIDQTEPLREGEAVEEGPSEETAATEPESGASLDEQAPKEAEAITPTPNHAPAAPAAPQAASDPGWKVDSVEFGQIRDGTAPWDADSEPGNDENDHNGIVRTFDQVTYMISYTTALTTQNPLPVGEAHDLWVKVEVPLSKKEFNFDLDNMLWMQDATIEEVTEGGVTKTVLTGRRVLENTASTGVVIPGGGELNICLFASACANGTQLRPTITLYTENLDGQNMAKTLPVEDAVTVSCRLMLDVGVDQNSHMNVKGTYSDPSTGTEYYGRILSFGAYIQMYNSTADKGLKGFLIPTGPIEFDITTSKLNALGDVTEHMIWDVKENNILPETGLLYGRQMNLGSSNLLSTCARLPANTHGGQRGLHDCFEGGQYTVSRIDDHTIHVVLRDYDFDYEQWHFPTTIISSDTQFPWAPPYHIFSTLSIETILEIADPDAVGRETVYVDASNFKYNDTLVHDYATEELIGNNRKSAGIILTTPGTFSISVDTLHYSTPLAHADAYGALTEAFNLRNSLTLTGDSPIGAFDYLVKFDNQAFEPNGNLGANSTTISSSNATRPGTLKTYYAAKPDKTGWASEQEMQETCIWDLVYFETTQELYANGYTPVGYFYELRDAEIYGISNTEDIILQTPTKIKKDENLVGNVYIAVPMCIEWDDSTKADGLSITNFSQDPSAYGKTTEAQYLAGYPIADHTAHLTKNEYEKTVYDENHVISHIHNSSINGASTLITAYRATMDGITKDGYSGAEKYVYDVDKGQRLATISFTPTLRWVSAAGQLPDVVEPELLLEVHVPNEHLTVLTDSIRMEGDETVDGGIISIETENVGSETVIRVKLADVQIQKQLRSLNFEVKIGEPGTIHDVHNNEQIDVYCDVHGQLYGIHTIWDKDSELSSGYWTGNWAKTSIQIVKLSDFAVIKYIESPKIEQNEHQLYSLRYVNVGNNETRDVLAIDVLPYNGDSRGSNFHGTNTVQSLTITFPESPLSLADYINGDYHVWFTTNTSVRGKPYNEISDMSTWTQATAVADNNKIVVSDIPENAVAIAFNFSVASKECVFAALDCYNPGQQPGDVYGNNYEEYAPGQSEVVASNQVSATVVGRTVSGLVWKDTNANNMQELVQKGCDNAEIAETTISGVSVRLMRRAQIGETGEVVNGLTLLPATDIFGNPIQPITTNAQGEYSFTDLAAGTFYILFEGLSASDCAYLATANVGGDASLDSDGALVGTVDDKPEKAWIPITMPQKNAIQGAQYRLENEDVGLSNGVGSLKVTKFIEGTWPSEKNGRITFGWRIHITGLAPNNDYTIKTLVKSYLPDEFGNAENEEILTRTADETGSIDFVDTGYVGKAGAGAYEQSATFYDLPAGAQYTVKENDYVELVSSYAGRTLMFMNSTDAERAVIFPKYIDHVEYVNNLGAIEAGETQEAEIHNYLVGQTELYKTVKEVRSYKANGTPNYNTTAYFPTTLNPQKLLYEFEVAVYDRNGQLLPDWDIGFGVKGSNEALYRTGSKITMDPAKRYMMFFVPSGYKVVLTETAAIKGTTRYENLTKPLVVTIDGPENSGSNTVEAANIMNTTDVRIRKINQTLYSQTGEVKGIPNVTFTVCVNNNAYNATSGKWLTVTTDENGYATIPNLSYGKTYVVFEMRNPERFDPALDDYLTVSIDPNTGAPTWASPHGRITVWQRDEEGTPVYCIPNNLTQYSLMPATGGNGINVILPFAALAALLLCAMMYRKREQKTM